MSGASKSTSGAKAGDRDPGPVVNIRENVTPTAAQQHEPAAVHEPFSWLDARLSNDHQAQFVALTMDVCNGVQTCLQLLHSDMLARNANQWADPGQKVAPMLNKAGGERLLLLATAAARMLSERAENHIEALNDRAPSAAEGGAA